MPYIVSYISHLYNKTVIALYLDCIKQLLTFLEVNMFVCRPENPILTEAVAEVNIMDVQVCKQTY